MAWEEIITARTRTAKTYQDSVDQRQRALSISVSSMHYQEDPDNPDDPWLEIDNNIVAASSPWDYEVVKNNWQLKVKDDGTIAIFKSGHHFGSKLIAFAYLEITTKNYTILKTANSVSPAVTGNSIRWNNIVDGVNLVIYAQNDYLKEQVEITQVARDWCVAHPPSDYGYVNADTYLVIIYQCDWSDPGQPELYDGTIISLENWEGEEAIYFRNLIKDELMTEFPMDHAYHIDDTDRDNLLNIRKRMINSVNNYLVMGVPVLDLNALPTGTVIFDPTINTQVAAGNRDASQIESAGTMDVTNATYVRMYSSSNPAAKRWGGFIWTGAIPLGSTITNAYVNFYVVSTTYDDADLDLHFEKVADPAVFVAVDFNISSRTITAASYNLSVSGAGIGWYSTGAGSLTAVLQEVVDNFTTVKIALLVKPKLLGAGSMGFYAEPFEAGAGHSALLYVTYTLPAGGAGAGLCAAAGRLLI